jgi:hypothetical protein
MPKYRILAEHSVTEAWTYIVEADDADQAIEMVQDCPEGECDGIERLQDNNVYDNDIYYEVMEEIKEPKPKKKKATIKK